MALSFDIWVLFDIWVHSDVIAGIFDSIMCQAADPLAVMKNRLFDISNFVRIYINI